MTNALELATFEVTDVILGDRTAYDDGVLTIDASELRARLMEEGDFADVTVDVVRPRDDVRIIHVVDSVEPRVRVSEPGTDFPGMLSIPRTVGRGRTHRLDGVVITEVAEPVPGEPTYWREAIFDMAGDGAKYSPFSNLINVVLTFHPNDDRFAASDPESAENVFEGTPEAMEHNRAIRLAGLKAAVALAETTKDASPRRVDTYELNGRGNGLPKVVYLYQIALPYIYGEVAPGARGQEIAGQLPSIIHPNEIFDGAMVNSFSGPASTREVTFLLQNHPVIEELYARNGHDLDLQGVVWYTFADSVRTKERISSYAANLAMLLRADGAVLNYLGGGHPAVDFMMTCQKLEQLGVKTALLSPEMAANPEDSGFVHFVPEANAIVSTGNYEQTVDLPAVSRVIGGTNILETGDDASGQLAITLRHILSATDQLGLAALRGRLV